VRRYLGGFGPATTAEIGNWAGLPVRTVTDALRRVDHVTYEADDGATLVDLPQAPLPDAGTPAPIRFLPTWDAVLLVHARPARILPRSIARRSSAAAIRTRFPPSSSTVSSPDHGGTSKGGSTSRSSTPFRAACGVRSSGPRATWRRSTPERRPTGR
jgi:hypothetical protein